MPSGDCRGFGRAPAPTIPNAENRVSARWLRALVREAKDFNLGKPIARRPLDDSYAALDALFLGNDRGLRKVVDQRLLLGFCRCDAFCHGSLQVTQPVR